MRKSQGPGGKELMLGHFWELLLFCVTYVYPAAYLLDKAPVQAPSACPEGFHPVLGPHEPEGLLSHNC
jgi:hypothetical protein